MDRRERERILKEGGVGASLLAHADEQRLVEDLEGSPLRGKPLRRRLRNFRPDVATYVVSLGGPRPYMARLRDIDELVRRHELELSEARAELAASCRDAGEFADRWRTHAHEHRFDEVNGLIERHNRFFPAEARLPMDPRTGDFVLVAGDRYDRRPLDAEWVLERFPAELERAA